MRYLLVLAMLGSGAYGDETCKKVKKQLEAFEDGPDNKRPPESELEVLRNTVLTCGRERPARVKAIVDKIENVPLIKRWALSVDLCVTLSDKEEVLRKINKEKKYANASGVMRLGDLNSLRYELEEADQKIESLFDRLRELKSKPMSCKDPRVRELSMCLYADEPDYCEDDESLAMVQIIRSQSP